MNSLVVLFSIMALASAKPSLSITSYAAPALAIAPAAVSHQSRIDIKSSPAIVRTNIVAPAIGRIIAPVAYSAPVGIAPAAVSSQSRIDIKSSPAVISTISSGPLAYNTPLAYSAPLAYSSPLTYSSQIAYSAPLAGPYTSIYNLNKDIAPEIAPVIYKTAAIKPEAESSSSNAVSEEAALPVAPSETPEVAAARAAHLEAKAFEESHQIEKRSVGIIAPSILPSYTAPIVTSYAAPSAIYKSPIASISPIALPTPVLTGAYGVHPY